MSVGAARGSTAGADQQVEQRQAARQALAALAALPGLQRQVMLSAALEGRSHEEIAVALGLSHGAVRGLIYRARATLRAAAAALIPGPVVSWVARQPMRSRTGAYEAIAGGGSVGVGGLLAKGGVIAATAGALASVAGLAPTGGTQHRAVRVGPTFGVATRAVGPRPVGRPALRVARAPAAPVVRGAQVARGARVARAGPADRRASKGGGFGAAKDRSRRAGANGWTAELVLWRWADD